MHNEQSGTTGHGQQQNNQVIDVVRNAIRTGKLNIQSKFAEIASKNKDVTVPQLERFYQNSQQNAAGTGTTGQGSAGYGTEDLRVASAIWQHAQDQPNFEQTFNREQTARDLKVQPHELDAIFSKNRSQVGAGNAGQGPDRK